MIEYLKNEAFQKHMEQSGAEYQKSAETLLRKPKVSETSLTTYVDDNGALRKEANSEITPGAVIARNDGVIGELDGEPVYNEWVIPEETAIKNYGSEVIDSLSTSEFSAHKKKATIQAVELTSEVMDMLGQSGDELAIKVSWSDEPMIAKVGDYLSNQGYSISKTDMAKTYEAVNPTTQNNSSFVEKLKQSVDEPEQSAEGPKRKFDEPSGP